MKHERFVNSEPPCRKPHRARISQAVQPQTALWGLLLTCLLVSPCKAQVWVIQDEVGTRNKVDTKNSLAFPVMDWIGAVTYKLAGDARVGNRTDVYDDPWKNKLSVPSPPIALGTNDLDSASASGSHLTYVAAATSSIETKPISLGVTLESVNVGLLMGAQAKMQVQASISPIDPQGNPGLYAEAFVYDPFAFTDFPSDDAVHLSTALQKGDHFSVQGAGGQFQHSLVATTDVPGLETLYRLDITGMGTGLFTGTAADTDVTVAFISNPVLGLSDADITAAILRALMYSPAARQFEFTSDVTLFDGLMEIPDSVRDFHLALTESAIATNQALPPPGSSVPEPSGLTFLIVFGTLAGLAGARTRRRR